MSFTSQFSMQGTLAVRYADSATIKVSDVEAHAERLLTHLGIGPDHYRITSITMGHDAYITSTEEARVEFDVIGDFKE